MSKRIVIIGGVAGGMSAATRARRVDERASITVLEKGGFVSFANCGLPYFVAGRIKSQESLLITTPERVRQRYNIDARVRSEAIAIDRARKEVEVKDLERGGTYRLPYDKLIIATGAKPIVPPIEHVDAPNVMLLRSMEDTIRLQGWLREHRPGSAVIVGAGFIGLEMAEAMRDRGVAVTLVEKAPHVLPPLDGEMAGWLAEELERNEVRLITGIGLTGLHARDGRVHAVELEDGRRVEAELVLLSIGVRPNVGIAAEAGLKLGSTGAIEVDQWQRTSDPDIYAVGDASEALHGVTGKACRMPLAGPANRQGRLAGEHAAAGRSAAAGKVLGTAIVQVFDLSVGVTGLGEAAARAAGFEVETAYVMPGHHAGYYPDAKPVRIKLIYDDRDGRILGAQMVGAAGVDKRIDIIATAMHFGGTVDDLAQLDLAYAPQFGSAKDPIHMAAMVAQNQRSGMMAAASAAEGDGCVLVDVRTAEEHAAGCLPGSVSVPLDELRDRAGELDPGRATMTYCQIGMRGYVAQRMLKQMGFGDVRNLKGGYALAEKQARD
jgi:NADPH-dependent 2,4-dienoyl-CoA reductase/sulfur reductase-like enzyme/rhodanese-related sulfurtransferase